MNEKIMRLIYELKGIVNAASNLSNYGEEFDNPLIEQMEVKTNEIINIIEEKYVSNGTTDAITIN